MLEVGGVCVPTVGFVWVNTEIRKYFTIVEVRQVQQAHTH